MAAGGWSYLGTRSLCLLRLNRTLNPLASRMGNKICSYQLDGWLYGVEVCLGVQEVGFMLSGKIKYR